MVLLQQPIVDDLASLAQLVGAGVDQRTVVQMLVRLAGDRIDGQQRAVQVGAALAHESVGVLQVDCAWPPARRA